MNSNESCQPKHNEKIFGKAEYLLYKLVKEHIYFSYHL